MTVRELSHGIRSALTPRFGAGEASAMERIILEDVMRLTPVETVLRVESAVPPFIPGKIDAILTRLQDGEPIQYVMGHARFCGLTLKVTPDVLIPRPETEQLADMVADFCGDRTDLRLLDCGTGSGCIAISLARRLRFPAVTAIDVSDAALAVARENAAASGVRVDFRRADLLDACSMPAGQFDVIVSNPPYVMESERTLMEPHVLDHEPGLALFVPDGDPLRFYRAVLGYAASHLADDGAVFFEINPLQSGRYAALAAESGFSEVEITADLYGRRRFAVISRRR